MQVVGSHESSVEDREKGQLQVEIGMLCRYIGILIGEIRGHRMSLPPTPPIPSRVPLIRQHELEYMLAPPKSAGSWEYTPLDDWARGLVLGYVPGSLANQVNPFMGPIAGSDANDGNARRFADDVVRDDDFP